jgi:hypothetical protein
MTRLRAPVGAYSQLVRRDLTERPVVEVGRPILVEEWWPQNARGEHDLKDFRKQKGVCTVKPTSLAGGLK